MESAATPSPAAARVVRREAAGSGGFNLHELRNGSPLVVQLLPSGAVHAFRHETTLINQVLPGPAEDGLFRLILRWRDAAGGSGSAALAGAGLAFGAARDAAAWQCGPVAGLTVTTTLQLHPTAPAWAWKVRLENRTGGALQADVLYGQDLGIADEAAVRNNEAYTSQYIDLLPVENGRAGWAILARQNQAMAGGRHPWLATGCLPGAAEFCTDGSQFFGADHRLTNAPAVVRAGMPSRRLQYESALAGLQSREVAVAAGENTEIIFLSCFVADHPEASGPADLAVLSELQALAWLRTSAPATAPASGASLFVRAGWLHGRTPTEADWSAWFPGVRRHEERDPGGALRSFFHGDDTHVVSRDKEAVLARPHGHLLRSGGELWIDPGQFGFTCYAAGIFGAQAYYSNPSFARLTSVVRNSLNVARAQGQRVFVRHGGTWRQLGIPSAFAMTPGDSRWIYRLDDAVIEARMWCAGDLPAAFLELFVRSGAPAEFLVTHQLVVGATDFEHPAALEFHPDDGWCACQPAADSLMGKNMAGTVFVIASVAAADFTTIAGDGPLYEDGVERGGPYLALQTRPVSHCAVALGATPEGLAAVPALVFAARRSFGTRTEGRPPGPPMEFVAGAAAGIGRVNEILPWFTHNAWIHFSAPRGLEQYGGAAWGVRDVCQGSVEWLLAAGELAVVRRILAAVFAQQYPDGTWPQWFMHPPFRFIQQAHSHGDVCFWPAKALCDYLEASNDLAFLGHRCGYTDPKHFGPTGASDTIIEHCDRLVAHVQSRFLPGTALVNYGDGDWDDTLQPADPAMRTHMTSAWTVGLAFHTFRQLAHVHRRNADGLRAAALELLLNRMRADFAQLLEPGGVVAGFLIREPGGDRLLLHPRDEGTGIRYRLLPMSRGILAEIFTPEEARRHFALIQEALRYPDGVRLMSEPARYHGGRERWFKRAESAANVGREIGLQYVHAHLRYLEAAARMGEAAALWHGFQVVNPVALEAVLPHAAPRQANAYFSSSDADFADRYEAERRWEELRDGRVAVRGGWRVYSSGPGLYLHKLRTCLLGLRECYGDFIFDPVLPRELDGLAARVQLCGRTVTVRYSVGERGFGPRELRVNGTVFAAVTREENPYREGGLRARGADLSEHWREGANEIEILL